MAVLTHLITRFLNVSFNFSLLELFPILCFFMDLVYIYICQWFSNWIWFQTSKTPWIHSLLLHIASHDWNIYCCPLTEWVLHVHAVGVCREGRVWHPEERDHLCSSCDYKRNISWGPCSQYPLNTWQHIYNCKRGREHQLLVSPAKAKKKQDCLCKYTANSSEQWQLVKRVAYQGRSMKHCFPRVAWGSGPHEIRSTDWGLPPNESKTNWNVLLLKAPSFVVW